MGEGFVPSRKKPDEYKRAAMSEAEIAELNARRSPSERIGEDVLCGGRLNDAAIRRFREKGVNVVTCQKKAGAGTAHPGVGYCKWHGGNTSAGLKHAAKLAGKAVIERQKKAMDEMDIQSKFGGSRATITITPEEALLEEVRRSVAMVRWLEDRIGQWRTDEMSDENDDRYSTAGSNNLPPLVTETSRGAASFTNEREWLLLYRTEREHAARVANLAIGAGIAERMVHIAEDQGRMLALAVKAVLSALVLSPDQLALVPTVVPNILRQVALGVSMESPDVSPLPDIAPNTSLVKRPGALNVPGYLQSRDPGEPE